MRLENMLHSKNFFHSVITKIVQIILRNCLHEMVARGITFQLHIWLTTIFLKSIEIFKI